MGPKERHQRALQLVVEDTEHLELVSAEHWYRRGPPCPVCEDPTIQGVVFAQQEDDGREACVVCNTAIDVAPYGPRQTGPRIRVVFPPDSDDLAKNPYLNPLIPRAGPLPAGLSPIEVAERQDYNFRASFVAAGPSDIGNGRRLARLWSRRIRYTRGWGWLVYDGRRWLRDDIGTIQRLAKATLEEGLRILESSDAAFWESVEADFNVPKKAFHQEIMASFSRGKVEAMMGMAESESDVVAKSSDFDQEPWLLNCMNGVIDLMSGQIRPHDAELYITQLVPHAYPLVGAGMQPACPRWEAFLRDFTCGNEDLADLLQRLVGYTLTGETREQKLVFLYGDGANGKSTFLEVVRHILGDYGTHLSFEALLKTRTGTPEQAFAFLPGKRYATASEAGEARAWNEEAVKSITGGDTIRAKFLYQDTFEFRPVAKIWVAANERPRIDGANEGIWRRFLLVPCLAEIPPERRDPGLFDALKEEAPGILAWAVRGAMRWYREGLRNLPACVRTSLDEYREDNDSLSRFIADCCEVDPNLSVGSSDLLKAQKQWAKELGEKEFNQTSLSTRLARWRGGRLKKTRAHGGRFRWEGIGLKLNLAKDEEFRRGLGAYDRP